MDWRSFLVGWGVGVISWWAQGLIVQRMARRKLQAFMQQLERQDGDHRAGRRCEIKLCTFCERDEERQPNVDTLNSPLPRRVPGDGRDA